MKSLSLLRPGFVWQLASNLFAVRALGSQQPHLGSSVCDLIVVESLIIKTVISQLVWFNPRAYR